MILLALFFLGVSVHINQLIAMEEQPPLYEGPSEPEEGEQPPSYEELYGPQEPAPGYEEELPAEE